MSITTPATTKTGHKFEVMGSTSMIGMAWADPKAGRRYHVWINRRNGTPEDVVYSNPIERTKGAGSETRKLDGTAKKWAPLIAAMWETVQAEDMIARHDAAVAEDKAAAVNAARAESLSRLRGRIVGTGEDKPLSAAALTVAARIAALSDDDLEALAVRFYR